MSLSKDSNAKAGTHDQESLRTVSLVTDSKRLMMEDLRNFDSTEFDRQQTSGQPMWEKSWEHLV